MPRGRPDHLLRLCRTHDTREALGSAEVGKDPVLVLEEAGLRPAREHADVAHERELQSGAEGVAAHGGDRRVPRGLEPRVGLLHAQDRCRRRVVVGVRAVDLVQRVVAAAPGEDARVDAGRERAPVADDDERADRVVVLDLAAERPHLLPHPRREAVELVGAVQTEPGDVARAGQLERFHRSRGSRWRAVSETGERARVRNPAVPPRRAGGSPRPSASPPVRRAFRAARGRRGRAGRRSRADRPRP